MRTKTEQNKISVAGLLNHLNANKHYMLKRSILLKLENTGPTCSDLQPGKQPEQEGLCTSVQENVFK